MSTRYFEVHDGVFLVRLLLGPGYLCCVKLRQDSLPARHSRSYGDGLPVDRLCRFPTTLSLVKASQCDIGLAGDWGYLNGRLELGQGFLASSLSGVHLSQTDVIVGIGRCDLNRFLIERLGSRTISLCPEQPCQSDIDLCRGRRHLGRLFKRCPRLFYLSRCGVPGPQAQVAVGL